METAGGDPRRMWSPADRARADGLASQWGGIVSYAVGADGVRVEWLDPRGYRVTVAGVDVGELLGMLSTMLRERYAESRNEAGHIHSEGLHDGDV
jgi:hypothetical protein